MTLLAFEPPSELVAFAWDATLAAAAAVNADMDPGGRVPRVAPTQVISPIRWRHVARARCVLAQLLRRHVFVHRRKSDAGDATLAIFVHEAPGVGWKSLRPISTPMLGYLLGRDHSAFISTLFTGDERIGRLIVAAEGMLAEQYPDPAPIVTRVTFRGRIGRAKKESPDS